MAISTYAELTESVAKYAHRGSSLDLLIPDFIQLAEYEMYNNDVESLKVMEDEKVITDTTSTVTQYLDLPSDFGIIRSIKFNITGEDGFLQFRTPEQLNRIPTTGRPYFFTVVANQIEFDRVPDEELTVQIQYISEVAALTSSNTTNVILTNHPNIYLFGTLAQAHIYTQDTEEQAKYENKFYRAIRGANKAAKRSRFGSAPVMKVAGPTP